MSSSNRRAILALPLILAACGFAPAIGPNADALMGQVTVQEPKTRHAFDFVKHMESRLGRSTSDMYALDYVIKTEKVSLGVTPDGDITRYNLLGTVEWSLTARDGGKTLVKGRAENFTSWSATGSTAAGLTAETDASSRLMRILADQIVAHLIAASAAGRPQ